MSAFKKIFPLLNRIVVKRFEAQTKTASGIIVNKPESNSLGVVIEAGPGAHDQNGKIIPLCVKTGDKVLLPEYGGQKLNLEGQELFIFRDSEVIARVE